MEAEVGIYAYLLPRDLSCGSRANADLLYIKASTGGAMMKIKLDVALRRDKNVSS